MESDFEKENVNSLCGETIQSLTKSQRNFAPLRDRSFPLNLNDAGVRCSRSESVHSVKSAVSARKNFTVAAIKF
jgi:hypothetical protein